MAAIGYCFGGTMALELARAGTDLAGVVGFHSGLQTSAPAATGDVKAPVLVCIGAEDPIVPPDQRAAFEEEMRAAGVDWRMVLYGGAAHSFTNPNAARMAMPGIEYNEGRPPLLAGDDRLFRGAVQLTPPAPNDRRPRPRTPPLTWA